MNGPVEVVVLSDASGQLGSASVLDPQTGNTLITYRGGGPVPARALGLLGGDHVLCADEKRPLLHAWALHSQEPVHRGVRLVTPGRVAALAASPDGTHVVAAVAEKLHVWQVASGCMVGVAEGHAGAVTAVRFLDDGSHFVSAGEDCAVAVWSLAQLASVGRAAVHEPGRRTPPRHVFRDHSLPVSDLHVGAGGARARVFTASADRTCKVYDLSSGTLLLTVVFDRCLTAVAADALEGEAFVGTAAGDIFQFSLRDPPRGREQLVHRDEAKMFVGHTGAVTCLSVSLDGATLLSGSSDRSVVLWDVPSRQAVRTLPCKGAVSNAFFHLAPRRLFSEPSGPRVTLHSLQRSTLANARELVVDVVTTEETGLEPEDPSASLEDASSELEHVRTIAELKKINALLYKFAAEKLLQPFTDAVGQTDETAADDPSSVQNKKRKKRIKKKKAKNKYKIL
ncbi:WD repeat-containing protein 18 isoform X2 [Bacillus rossius redtenbacheri]